MADDNLNDPDKSLDDDMADFLKEGGDEPETAEPGSDEASSVDTESPGSSGAAPRKSIFARIKDKIPPKLKTRKAAVIFAAGIFIFIALAAGLWMVLFKGDADQAAELPAGTLPGTETDVTVEKEIVFEDIVELEPFERIHLKTRSTMGLLSLNVALELTDHRYRKQIYAMEDRIRQIVTTQVAEMTWLELRNPSGKIRLKYELLKRINSLFPKPTVRHVFFTYFLMQ